MRLAWIVVVASVLPLMAADEPLVVRAYNTYGLSASDLQTASETVTRLLSDVAPDVRWRNCVIAGRRSHAGADRCADRLARNEFIVRLVAGGRGRIEDRTAVIGYSFIDPVQRVGSLATVYADRAVSLSAGFGASAGTMVGRAIAHELGHLLAGSHAHTDSGLMRQNWRPGLVPSVRDADWAFTRAQALAMRSGLEARRR
jgi:hypothetical protein